MAFPGTGPRGILSADVTPGQVGRLVARSAHAFLAKPLDIRQLLTLMDELLPGGEG